MSGGTCTVTAAEPRSAPATTSLADSVLLLIFLTGAQRLIGFGRGVLFCRWLDPAELGLWDIAFSFLVLAAPLTVLGLPGCFGRYVEQYRQRNRLRMFLARVTTVSLVLAVAGTAVLLLWPRAFASLVFGGEPQARLMIALAGALAAVIAYNFLVELFTGLRQYRVVTRLQFGNSLLFAGLGTALLLARPNAESVVIAYGGACLVSVLLAGSGLRQLWQELPAEAPPQHGAMQWRRLITYAGWVWVGNLAWNSFAVADRYMILHYGNLSAARALEQVGQYHSSRVVPLLLVSIPLLLGSMITPHLSRDWEAGRRDDVCRRLNLTLKLLGLGLTLAGVLVLLFAPLLFGVALQGKFQAGQAILAETLVYCIWCGMATVAMNWLWCNERAGLGSLALACGLAANIGLNLLLLPRWELYGAVIATLVSNLLVLLLVYAINRMLDMRIDRWTWILSALPAALWFGPWCGLAALVALAVASVRSESLFSSTEKHELLTVFRSRRGRVRSGTTVEPLHT